MTKRNEECVKYKRVRRGPIYATGCNSFHLKSLWNCLYIWNKFVYNFQLQYLFYLDLYSSTLNFEID
jgi:hypothetical protein